MGRQSRLRSERRQVREQAGSGSLETRVHDEVIEAHLTENRGRTLFLFSAMMQSPVLLSSVTENLRDGRYSHYLKNYSPYFLLATLAAFAG